MPDDKNSRSRYRIKDITLFQRLCPQCKTTILHNRIDYRKEAEQKGLLCHSCGQKKRSRNLTQRTPSTRVCVECKAEKPKTDYPKGTWRCGDCREAYRPKKDEVLRRMHRANLHYINKYCIGIEQVEQMYIAQSGKCAICERDIDTKKALHVDHDHATGKVRQLLCMWCNQGLGQFNDNVEVMRKAIDYVNKWKENHTII